MINKSLRAKLTVAFSLMRKAGLIARQNFACCGSCAGAEIAVYVAGLSKIRRSKIKGVCTYNRQAYESMNSRTGTGVFLGYGNIDSSKVGIVGLPTEKVGQIVMACLMEAGLHPEWDGKPETRIWVPLV